jgi:hypothetical protein
MKPFSFEEEIFYSDERDEAFNAILSNWIVGATFFLSLFAGRSFCLSRVAVAHVLLSYFYKPKQPLLPMDGESAAPLPSDSILFRLRLAQRRHSVREGATLADLKVLLVHG